MKVNLKQSGGNLNFESAKFSKEELAHKLSDAKLNTSESITPPLACVSINDGDEKIPICTLGNFSLIIGKAKSRKTFFTSLLVGSILKISEQKGKIAGCLPAEQKTVLYFDTEQSRYHSIRTANCILQVAEKKTCDNFIGYCLRQFTAIERLKIIEYAIESVPNLGVVVIDGLRDLITAINDESQATILSSFLLKWSEEKNIHIIGVLHENKGDNNARGHIGTELVNKAESVLSVCIKSPADTYSKVEARYSRDKSFCPFYFTINDYGLPVLIKEPIEKNKSKQKKPEEYPADFYRELLEKIFLEKKPYNIGSIWPLLKKEFENLGIIYGNTLIQNTIKGYLTEDLKLLVRDNKGLFSYLG